MNNFYNQLCVQSSLFQIIKYLFIFIYFILLFFLIPSSNSLNRSVCVPLIFKNLSGFHSKCNFGKSSYLKFLCTYGLLNYILINSNAQSFRFCYCLKKNPFKLFRLFIIDCSFFFFCHYSVFVGHECKYQKAFK